MFLLTFYLHSYIPASPTASKPMEVIGKTYKKHKIVIPAFGLWVKDLALFYLKNTFYTKNSTIVDVQSSGIEGM